MTYYVFLLLHTFSRTLIVVKTGVP